MAKRLLALAVVTVGGTAAILAGFHPAGLVGAVGTMMALQGFRWMSRLEDDAWAAEKASWTRPRGR